MDERRPAGKMPVHIHVEECRRRCAIREELEHPFDGLCTRERVCLDEPDLNLWEHGMNALNVARDAIRRGLQGGSAAHFRASGDPRLVHRQIAHAAAGCLDGLNGGDGVGD